MSRSKLCSHTLTQSSALQNNFFRKYQDCRHKVFQIGADLETTQPLCTNRMWHKVNFWMEFNRFEFRIFFPLDRLPHQKLKSPLFQFFMYSWIHYSHLNISTLWNADILVQYLNLGCHVNFLWCYKHLYMNIHRSKLGSM